MPPIPLPSAAPPGGETNVGIGISPDKKHIVLQSNSGSLMTQLQLPLDLAEKLASGILDRVRTARDEKLVLVDILGREKSFHATLDIGKTEDIELVCTSRRLLEHVLRLLADYPLHIEDM